MRLGRVWRVFIGEVGREVARSASSEIAEHVAQALLGRVRDLVGKPSPCGPTTGKVRDQSPADDDDDG
jgi:hypothetical protein